MTDGPFTQTLAGTTAATRGRSTSFRPTWRQKRDTAPADDASRQTIVLDCAASPWRDRYDIRAAAATLAQLGETYPDFDLGRRIVDGASVPERLEPPCL
jgi:hypothetical protein